MRLKMLGLCASIVLVLVSNAFTQGKISGLMFGDYYYIVTNHNENLEGKNGFWFRRIYFTYDHGLSDAFSLRFRIEMNSEGKFKSKSESLNPEVKDAYLTWKYGLHGIILGISGSPIFGLVEKIWGYRSLEKTPLDLHKFAKSRDFGVAIKGSLDSEKLTNYHLMVGNGSGNASEENDGKKVMFALSRQMGNGLVVEGYFDFEARPGKTNRFTLQGLVGYQEKSARIGVLFAHQNRQVGEGIDDLKMQIGSVFGAAKLSEKAWGFARIDLTFDPNPDGSDISYIPFDNSARAAFLLGGLDFRPIDNVHLMPNVEVVLYGKNNAGVRPKADIIPRFTFHYVWK